MFFDIFAIVGTEKGHLAILDEQMVRKSSEDKSDLQIAVRERLRVRVFRTEHTLKVLRSKNFEVAVLSTLNSY